MAYKLAEVEFNPSGNKARVIENSVYAELELAMTAAYKNQLGWCEDEKPKLNEMSGEFTSGMNNYKIHCGYFSDSDCFTAVVSVI